MSLGKLLGKPSDSRIYAPDERLVLPHCRLGVEFECEGAANEVRNGLPRVEWAGYWAQHEERSLRDGGLELAFVEPLFGRDALTAIEGLCKHAIAKRWKTSTRTGLHVHVDIRDLEVPQLLGLCILYAIYEKAIYRWVGDNRDYNIFCLPWYKAEGGVMEAAEVLRGALKNNDEDHGQLIHASQKYERYAGFNLNAISKFGSVEWRQLKTTYNFNRILDWINILLAFKQATFRVPTSDGAILRDVELYGATQFGRSILGPQFNLLNYPELEEDVQNFGLPTAHELVREGLGGALWDALVFPTGPNRGFQRFLEGPVLPLDQALVIDPGPPPEPQGPRHRTDRVTIPRPRQQPFPPRAMRLADAQIRWPHADNYVELPDGSFQPVFREQGQVRVEQGPPLNQPAVDEFAPHPDEAMPLFDENPGGMPDEVIEENNERRLQREIEQLRLDEARMALWRGATINWAQDRGMAGTTIEPMNWEDPFNVGGR